MRHPGEKMTRAVPPAVNARVPGQGFWAMLRNFLIEVRDSLETPLCKTYTADFGSTAVREAVFRVSDADIAATDRVSAWQGSSAALGRQADENEMDALVCRAIPETGGLRIVATAVHGRVVGPYVLHYAVG